MNNYLYSRNNKRIKWVFRNFDIFLHYFWLFIIIKDYYHIEKEDRTALIINIKKRTTLKRTFCPILIRRAIEFKNSKMTSVKLCIVEMGQNTSVASSNWTFSLNIFKISIHAHTARGNPWDFFRNGTTSLIPAPNFYIFICKKIQIIELFSWDNMAF